MFNDLLEQLTEFRRGFAYMGIYMLIAEEMNELPDEDIVCAWSGGAPRAGGSVLWSWAGVHPPPRTRTPPVQAP